MTWVTRSQNIDSINFKLIINLSEKRNAVPTNRKKNNVGMKLRSGMGCPKLFFF